MTLKCAQGFVTLICVCVCVCVLARTCVSEREREYVSVCRIRADANIHILKKFWRHPEP